LALHRAVQMPMRAVLRAALRADPPPLLPPLPPPDLCPLRLLPSLFRPASGRAESAPSSTLPSLPRVVTCAALPSRKMMTWALDKLIIIIIIIFFSISSQTSQVKLLMILDTINCSFCLFCSPRSLYFWFLDCSSVSLISLHYFYYFDLLPHHHPFDIFMSETEKN
jgi:hypothetical protein